MRHYARLGFLFVAITIAIGLPLRAAQAREYLPEIGGYDGAQYDAPCVPGQNLIGFEIRNANLAQGGAQVIARDSVSGYLPYLVLFACPLIHVFMHHGAHHQGAHSSANHSTGAGRDSA